MLIYSEVSSYYALTRPISAGTRVTSQYIIPRDPGYSVTVTVWQAFASVVIPFCVNPQLAEIFLIPHLSGLRFSAAIDVASVQPVGQLVYLLPLIGLAVGNRRTHLRADKFHAGTFRDRVFAEELVLSLIQLWVWDTVIRNRNRKAIIWIFIEWIFWKLPWQQPAIYGLIVAASFLCVERDMSEVVVNELAHREDKGSEVLVIWAIRVWPGGKERNGGNASGAGQQLES